MDAESDVLGNQVEICFLGLDRRRRAVQEGLYNFGPPLAEVEGVMVLLLFEVEGAHRLSSLSNGKRCHFEGHRNLASPHRLRVHHGRFDQDDHCTELPDTFAE